MSETIMDQNHIELVFDGLYDRVSGNETYASRYLDGVLWSNAEHNYRVNGTEGFLQGVSDGIKKAITYILEQIKKLWNWMFGKDEVRVTVEFKKKVQEKTKHAEDVVAASSKPVTESNKEENRIVAMAIKKMAPKADLGPGDGPIKTIEDLDKYMKGEQESSNSHIKLKEAYEETLKKLLNSNSYNDRVTKITKLAEVLKERAAALNKEENQVDDSLGQIATMVKNGLVSGEGTSLVTTLSQLTPSNLKTSMGKIRSHMTAMASNYQMMSDALKHLEKKIEALQRTVANTDDKEVKEELQACKKILVAVNEFGSTYKQLRTQLLSILDMF